MPKHGENHLTKNIPSEREYHPEFRMIETVNQGLTHKKPNSDTNRYRYHRSPDVDTTGISGDTSRLRETGLPNKRILIIGNVAGGREV